MRKIKTLSDKATLRTLKDEINEQFAALGAQAGVELTIGKITYDHDGSFCSFKVEVAVVGDDGNAMTEGAKYFLDFAHRGQRWNECPLLAEDLFRNFAYDGRTYKIVGRNQRAPKYCIDVERDDGKPMGFPVITVANALGRKVLDENRPKAVPMKTIESLDDLRQLAEGGNE